MEQNSQLADLLEALAPRLHLPKAESVAELLINMVERFCRKRLTHTGERLPDQITDLTASPTTASGASWLISVPLKLVAISFLTNRKATGNSNHALPLRPSFFNVFPDHFLHCRIRWLRSDILARSCL